MIPQLTGDRRLHAQIPPVVIKRIAGKLSFFIGGAAGHQIRPLAARGVVHIPVHQLANARHFWPLGQRRIRVSGRFIDAEGVLLAQALRGRHRVEPALLHQRMKNFFGLIITTALQQQIGLPVTPFIFLFGLHRQPGEPGIEPTTVARTQRHSHAALHQRRGVRTHNRIVSPARLLVGHIGAHQSPRHDIAQLLRLLLIKLLRLHQLRDHQPRVFHIVTRHAGKSHRRHLAGKIGRARTAGKGQDAVGIVCQRDNRRGDRLVIGRHLPRQRSHQTRITGFHRQADTLEVGQRILLAGSTPRAEQGITGVRLVFPGQPELFRPGPGLFLLAGRPFCVVVVTLRFGGIRLFRAKRQQPAPVFATRQFVHKTRLKIPGWRQGRVRLNEVIHGNGGLIHEIVRNLTILQIRIQRIILERRHQRLHGIHLLVVPCLFNLGIPVTLFIQ